MTDQYPPFRLDRGPHDPDDGVVVLAPPDEVPAGTATATAPETGGDGPAGSER